MPVQTTEVIKKLEEEIQKKKKELKSLKEALTPKAVEDYVFVNVDGKNTNLSEMFREHKYLVVIHNMGQKCKYCTMWANGFEGVYRHFHDKAGFVLVNHDSVETQKKEAQKNGWTFPMYSAENNSFNKDLGFTDDKNSPWPGVSTFRKKDDNEIDLLGQASFGPGDDFCSVWHIYDLLFEDYSY